MNVSKNWKYWKTTEDLKTCYFCSVNHGKVYSISETPFPKPPLHFGCRCVIDIMLSFSAGEATFLGKQGADWYLFVSGTLPNYYISKEDAKRKGWSSKKGNLASVAPGKMIYGGIYYNDNRHLPVCAGRIWYEADINYKSGKRNSERILFSNDGLIFVTYDHYNTFMEITE